MVLLLVLVVAGLVLGVYAIHRHIAASNVVDPTVPPSPPTRSYGAAALPQTVGGYTVIGATPAPGDTTVTYVSDADPKESVVVAFDSSGKYAHMTMVGSQWYGMSRCGLIWQGDSAETPRPRQAACVTILTNGVMTSVAGSTTLAPESLAVFANALYEGLG